LQTLNNICYSDGSVYEGGYVNGKRHGHGVYELPDGTVFDVSNN